MLNGDWAVPGYRHVRELGEGGTGRVMLAVREATGSPVAIKYLTATLRADRTFAARFREEARLLGPLEDPGLVRSHEYVESPLGSAIVMELVNGVSLASLIKAEGHTTPEAALVVFKASLLGLAAVHRTGIVHRDLKPANVLVGADGVCKVTDVGIAVRQRDDAPAAGAPAYLAPERWGGGPVTTATDIYAATAVFFECLTGEQPFSGASMAALAQAHRTARVALEQVPETLAPMVAAGLAKDPNDRPVTASVFLGRLEAVALATYGVGWEERGRSHLTERAAILRLLFPLSRPLPKAGGGPGLGVPGRGRVRRGMLAAAGAVLLLLGGTTAMVYASGGGDGTPDAKALPGGAGPSGRSAASSGPSSDLPPDDLSKKTGVSNVPATPANAGSSPSSAKPKPSKPGGGGSPDPSSPSPSQPSFGGAKDIEVTGLTLDDQGTTATAQVKVTADGKGTVTLNVQFFQGESPTEHGTAESVTVEVDGETTVQVTHSYPSCPPGFFSAEASAVPGSADPHALQQPARCSES